MARLITAGSETNDATLEGIAAFGGGAGIVTGGQFRSGSRSMRVLNTAAADSFATFNLTTTLGRTYYFRFYVRPDSVTGGRSLLIVQTGVTTPCRVDFLADGTLRLFNNIGSVYISGASAALTALVWSEAIELAITIGTGAVDTLELRYNGVVVGSATGLALAEDAIASFQLGSRLTGATDGIYFDDFALNDDQGSFQNGYPGEGKQVLLLPTADSARTGTVLFTGGAGGTTSLFDAVNNTPPVGLATETNTSQIEHAGGGGGSDAYDATMTTYAAAGLVAADTVTFINPITMTGEDINTGTKLLTHSVVSNPAIAAVANYDVNPASVATGTHPTGWTRHDGTLTYNPSVTVGTAPVMRVTRPETATRVASVEFMGMYVEYQAAATVLPAGVQVATDPALLAA